MKMTNDNLSADGFILTPQFRPDAILPPGGLDLCHPRFLSFSPPPADVGPISDFPSFSHGADIDVGGILIKNYNSDTVFLPENMAPFHSNLQTYIDNEFACDPDAVSRFFILTLTRCDVAPGEANRIHTAHWHRHWPSTRLDRAARIQATRSYTAADDADTEFYVGPCGNHLPNTTEPNYALPARHSNVFSSPTLHRTPLMPKGGRRTVLILGSYATNAEFHTAGNPMLTRLSQSDPNLRRTLQNRWRDAGQEIRTAASPATPSLQKFSSPLALER